MPVKNKVAITILLFIFTQISCILLAEEFKSGQTYLFQGEVKGNDINIRSDSTLSSEVICKVDKGEPLDVSSELYDWYKISLPQAAPSFIKKDFVTLSKDGKIAKVSADFVNIRLRPDISSPILGKVNKDEIVDILQDKGDWYRIKPVKNSFGWIHKSFVSESRKDITKDITVEGMVKQKTFTRVASHKLILEDNNKIYLLKADIEDLNPFNNRKVKITGKLVDPTKQKYPIIEVEKIEALD
jgi:uncharacterized protein YgiM (DUF1202 family)